MPHAPGTIRDAIVAYLTNREDGASVADIRTAVEQRIGPVPPSSIRSYLRLRPDTFERTRRGHYQLRAHSDPA